MSCPIIIFIYFWFLLGLPQFGQNFIFSSVVYPHSSLEQTKPPTGLGFPHSQQNLPSFTYPQLHVHVSDSGFGFPHSLQNFLSFCVPQWIHTHPELSSFTIFGF